MTQLADNRLIIRNVQHMADPWADPTRCVVAAIRGLFTTARWETFDPTQIDLPTIQVHRTPDGIEATARYGRLADDCDTCHQPPGRPHAASCPTPGLVTP